MNFETLSSQTSKNLLLIFLLLQFAFCFAVFLNIPIARQVIGFLYLTFVPGFVILKLLKLDGLDRLEIVVFSMGLSIAFLMLGGLLINEFLFSLGISEPLSLMPLMIILNSFIFVGGILACLRSRGIKLLTIENLRLSPLTLLLMGLPILSVIGATWVNAYQNNLILLFVIIAISFVFVIGAISRKLLPSKFYPLAVFVIAISILYHSSLISNYIAGHDIHLELFTFQTVQNNAYWDTANPYFGDIVFGRFHSMLSITILPTIYSSLLNMDPTWVFKLLFPLIFSFVPLGLYQVWRGYVGKKYAFISAFLFMSQETFYTEILGLNRQMVAELFFILLLLVFLNKKMKQAGRIVCFMVFSFGLITSHYGLSEIFLFFISVTVISLFVVKRPSKNITASMVVLFFVMLFTWYIYTSDSAVLDSILEFGNYVYSQLGEFFNLASREREVLRGLGLANPPTVWNIISRVFAYAIQFLIVVGFIGLVTKRVKVRFERIYFAFTFLAMTFLAALILVPGLANTMNMTRFYHILLFFLAPLCVLGSEVLVRFVFKRKKEIWTSILLLSVLAPYFLFQTSFVYELTGSGEWSVALSKYRMDKVRLYGEFGFIDEQSLFGVQWLSKNIDVEHVQIYADLNSQYKVLTSYGMIYRGSPKILTNTTAIATNGAVYLSSLNVAYGKIISTGFSVRDTSELDSLLSNLNKVYANSGSEVYINVRSGQ